MIKLQNIQLYKDKYCILPKLRHFKNILKKKINYFYAYNSRMGASSVRDKRAELNRLYCTKSTRFSPFYERWYTDSWRLMKYFPPPIHLYGFSNARKYTDFASSSEISISIKWQNEFFDFQNETATSEKIKQTVIGDTHDKTKDRIKEPPKIGHLNNFFNFSDTKKCLKQKLLGFQVDVFMNFECYLHFLNEITHF